MGRGKRANDQRNHKPSLSKVGTSLVADEQVLWLQILTGRQRGTGSEELESCSMDNKSHLFCLDAKSPSSAKLVWDPLEITFES